MTPGHAPGSLGARTVDRRQFPRYRLWLPARIDAGQGAQLAVGHDMSRTGVLLVTGEALEVGREVVLLLTLPPTGEQERSVRARIVRLEPNDADPHGLWPFRVGVEFLEQDETIETLVRDCPEIVEGRSGSDQQGE